MAGGRPTKLDAELIEKAQAYVTETESVGVHTLLPTIEGLALALGISRETVYDWERPVNAEEASTDNDELHAQFSDIVKDLRASQAQKLIQNALVGRYNPTIAKLILSGKHGYVEKAEVENSGQQKLIVETRRYNAPNND